MSKPKGFHLYYVKDRSIYRVRRSDWSNDTFNILDTRDLDTRDFDKVVSVCRLMSIPLIDETDDDD